MIITYYNNKNMKLQITFIDICYIIDSYSVKVIRKQVIQIIQEYKLEKKLGYFILNNVTNNNTYVKAIFCEI